MPTSDHQNAPDGCYFCDKAAGTLHHISYVPEKVVLMCSHCHGLVHSEGYDGTPLHPELIPDISRGEWEQEAWDNEWVPRPTLEQINWDSDDIGIVQM